jgi:hypothetical protein
VPPVPSRPDCGPSVENELPRPRPAVPKCSGRRPEWNCCPQHRRMWALHQHSHTYSASRIRRRVPACSSGLVSCARSTTPTIRRTGLVVMEGRVYPIGTWRDRPATASGHYTSAHSADRARTSGGRPRVQNAGSSRMSQICCKECGGAAWSPRESMRLEETLMQHGSRGIATDRPLYTFDNKEILMVPRGGIEPPTHGFSVRCSTN